MQSTRIDELSSKGFTEDPHGLRKFKQFFLVPSIIGVGVYAWCFGLLIFGDHKRLGPIIVAAVAWIFLAAMALIMYKSSPRSRYTGKPMLKYKNSSPPPNVVRELIYVCPDSMTFSRRVYVQGGAHAAGGAGGP